MKLPRIFLYVIATIIIAAVSNSNALKCFFCTPMPGTGQCGNISEQFCEIYQDVCVKLEGSETDDGTTIPGIMERGCATLAQLRNHTDAAEADKCHTVVDAVDHSPDPASGTTVSTFTGTVCVCSTNLCNTAVVTHRHAAHVFLVFPMVFLFLR
ncbi:uncharacterized protein LOC129592184 [Paramacrobiotus metropolitanus]|uniref:uncharacterized protein LOC129592184 n=1 Tax=Paramacrobiotus metropolitanus TaxID=2943436 RepID=UPI002445F15A|nr:uncharacterized protein LOC129592184 [Paramacrobiotus metropolitanus]